MHYNQPKFNIENQPLWIAYHSDNGKHSVKQLLCITSFCVSYDTSDDIPNFVIKYYDQITGTWFFEKNLTDDPVLINSLLEEKKQAEIAFEKKHQAIYEANKQGKKIKYSFIEHQRWLYLKGLPCLYNVQS